MPLLDDNDQLNGKLAGRISCDQIVPYPPGIPVLVPGQRITDNIVDYLIRYLRVQNKVELHGVVYQGYVPSIRVLADSRKSRSYALAAETPARKRPPERAQAARSAAATSARPFPRSSASARWCCRT